MHFFSIDSDCGGKVSRILSIFATSRFVSKIMENILGRKWIFSFLFNVGFLYFCIASILYSGLVKVKQVVDLARIRNPSFSPRPRFKSDLEFDLSVLMLIMSFIISYQPNYMKIRWWIHWLLMCKKMQLHQKKTNLIWRLIN